jgi:hypothetical protein
VTAGRASQRAPVTTGPAGRRSRLTAPVVAAWSLCVLLILARLKDAVDLDSVHDDLAVVVGRALEPAHVSLWISQRD